MYLNYRDVRSLKMRKTKLTTELHQLQQEYSTLKLQIFNLSNQRSKYTFDCQDELDALAEEERELCQYFDTTSDALCQSYAQKDREVNQAIKEKQQRIEEIKQKLALLQRSEEGKRNQIDHNFQKIKVEFQEMQDFFFNFKQEMLGKMYKLRASVNKLIQIKKDRATEKLNNAQEKINKLSAEKKQYLDSKNEKLQRLSLQSFVEFHFEYDDSEMRDQVKNIARQCNAVLNKAHQFSIKLNPLMQKFDFLERRINELIEKVNQTKIKISENQSQNSLNNWESFIFNLLRIKRFKKAIDDYTDYLIQTNEELEKKLRNEEENADQKVPGTNMTLFELRQEILKLSRQISEEINEYDKQLKLIEKEHHEYADRADKEIKELEAKVASTK